MIYDSPSYDFLFIVRRFDQGRHKLFTNLPLSALAKSVLDDWKDPLFTIQSYDFLFVDSRQETFRNLKTQRLLWIAENRFTIYDSQSYDFLFVGTQVPISNFVAE